jgi:hypothetical protein
MERELRRKKLVTNHNTDGWGNKFVYSLKRRAVSCKSLK